MNIIRWAAVAVTGLFVLMNLGAAIDPPGRLGPHRQRGTRHRRPSPP
jgi:hypothetical protein